MTQKCNTVDATIVTKMLPRLMLFQNNNYGYGNRTVTGETFKSKYMVNVNAYHKEGFYFYVMVLSERGRHVHQTNGGFVYVGLNADFSRSF